jgi:predicted Rossmann fold flavoprotein
MQSEETDVVIIGAGAAGLLCAAEAGKRGRKVTILDHAARAGEKIRISGGGRCNFTNLNTTPGCFLSENPRFCLSALTRYTPQDFVSLVEKHGIRYHEKSAGQLFCDGLAHQIVDMLLTECSAFGVSVRLKTEVSAVRRDVRHFAVETSNGTVHAQSLVVASGGLSIPKMGASNLGYRIASQFDLNVVATQPALVPFTMPPAHLETWSALAGVAVKADVRCQGQQFQDALLFTHRGLSGPAILQISSYWKPGDTVQVDLLPDLKLGEHLLRSKVQSPKQEVITVLAELWPKRLAQHQVDRQLPSPKRLGDMANRDLSAFAAALQPWSFIPNGTEGYRTAEVTRGGVDTNELSSKTMEARKVPGLYFIGEVVDFTGHLGGYNFQWAWASAYAAAQYV